MKSMKLNISEVLLSAVFAICVFVLLYTSGESYRRITSLTQTEKSIVHAHKIHNQLEQLYSNLREAESNQRAYVLTHDSSFYRSFALGIAEIDRYRTAVENLLKESREQTQNFIRMKALIDEREMYLHQNILLDRLRLKDSSVYLDRFIKGAKIMDSIQSQKQKMVEVEMAALRQQESHYYSQIDVPPRWILLSNIFSLLIFIAAFYKILRDIRKLKLANNHLLISKEIFEHSEKIAEISSFCWNLDNNVVTFSHNFYNLLGCEIHEIDSTFEQFLKFVHPDDRQILVESHQLMRQRTNTEPSIAYFRIIKKNNSLRYFKTIQKLIVDNYNTRIIIAIVADITEQYLNDKILEEKVFDLERSNNELSAFNHVASHDLQEPLRKVQTYISRIREMDYANFEEKTKEYFDRIQIASNRMQKLIDDLLLFSRANKAHKVFESCDLNLILENSKQELAQIIEEKHAIIQSNPLPTIMAIPFQIQQLFNNIIGNSLKYSKADRIPEIRIQVQKLTGKNIPAFLPSLDSGYYLISFSDNGIGFEAQYAEKIFTLFHRLHDNSAYSGTGIGLTICKKIVENHKGIIRAIGKPDMGATFNVYLPA